MKKRPDPLYGKLFLLLGWMLVTAVPFFFVMAFAIAAVVQGATHLKHSLGMSTPVYLLAVYALIVGGVPFLGRLSVWLCYYTFDTGKPTARRWWAGVTNFGLAVALAAVCHYAV